MNDDTIQSWSIFDPHYVTIQIFRTEHNKIIQYNPAILFFLNDGITDIDDNDKAITICTNMIYYDRITAILNTLNSIKHIFTPIASLVLIFDEDGNVIEELDLNELDEFYSDNIPEGVTIH